MEPPRIVPNARQRVRAAVTADIVAEARRQVAEVGAGALSLRAVARELGMASSAMYRYFASRDELLTALIVEAYDALGVVAEDAAEATAADKAFVRWQTVCRAIRRWAIEHPHEYVLLYGSPVPGYQAPQVTLAPASRVTLALAGLLRDAQASGELDAFDGPLVPRCSRATYDRWPRSPYRVSRSRRLWRDCWCGHNSSARSASSSSAVLQASSLILKVFSNTPSSPWHTNSASAPLERVGLGSCPGHGCVPPARSSIRADEAFENHPRTR